MYICKKKQKCSSALNALGQLPKVRTAACSYTVTPLDGDSGTAAALRYNTTGQALVKDYQ